MKEDRYEFPVSEWEYKFDGTQAKPDAQHIILTRKKPRVKVEWGNCSRFGDGLGEDGIDFSGHGYGRYHIVQFRVTGKLPHFKNTNILSVEGIGNCELVSFLPGCPRTRYIEAYGEDPPSIYIGSDARDKWSRPFLLPESIYSKLDEICKALEEKANEVKG